MKNSLKYATSIRQAFFRNRISGHGEINFVRDDLFVPDMVIKNIGDVPHAFKVGRQNLPDDIAECAPADKDYGIIGTGISHYKFTPVIQAFFAPDLSVPVVPMPEFVLPRQFMMANHDEQSILAALNRNNLIGPFLGMGLDVLQPARRMLVRNMGQVWVDELDVGNDPETGEDVIVPIGVKHKKSGKALVLSWAQITQDIAACRQLKPGMLVRPVGVLKLADRICLFEFEQRGKEIVVLNERHYAWG